MNVAAGSPGRLTQSARRTLAGLEAIVTSGLMVFVEVGLALAEIRDSRLYHETHATFESYCADRWGFTGRRGRQLIAAAEVGTVVPIANEAQARELAPLLNEPDQLREVWANVVAEHPEPTAADVREMVRRRHPVLTIPINEELLERQQRETLVQQLDHAVYSLESPPSTATAEAERLLAGGDPGPFTPSRFERVAAYAQAFARALRKAGIDG